MKNNKRNRMMKVHYTIVDGEEEYFDSFFMKSDGKNDTEQAYKALAVMFSWGDKEEEHDIMAALKTDGKAMIGSRGIKDVSVLELDTITVFVRGGVIQDIQNIPAGVKIRVQDYDVDNITKQELLNETEPDEEGDPCMVSFWENE